MMEQGKRMLAFAGKELDKFCSWDDITSLVFTKIKNYCHFERGTKRNLVR